MIRQATAADSAAILEIYAPYITGSAFTFETEVPPLAEFTERIEKIAQQYPFLVYETNGKIAGYCYASQHRPRAAYLYDVNVSIYISPEHHGKGIANKLYDCLFPLLARLGYKNVYADYTEPNEKSRKLHEKYGFTLIGTHHKTGYKLGKWHDVTWLEKAIGSHDADPQGVLSISEIPISELI